MREEWPAMPVTGEGRKEVVNGQLSCREPVVTVFDRTGPRELPGVAVESAAIWPG